MAKLGQVTRDIIRAINAQAEIQSKLVKGLLFAIIDILLGAKSITCTLYGIWGMNFTKNVVFKKNSFFFITFNFQFFHVITLLHHRP